MMGITIRQLWKMETIIESNGLFHNSDKSGKYKRRDALLKRKSSFLQLVAPQEMMALSFVILSWLSIVHADWECESFNCDYRPPESLEKQFVSWFSTSKNDKMNKSDLEDFHTSLLQARTLTWSMT